jgi:hypothetical protein
MKHLLVYILVFSSFVPFDLFAQTDTIESATLRVDGKLLEEDSVPETRPTERNPKRASLMSAVVPGLGQIYNKKYWKLPVIYGGMGVATYFILSNRSQYLGFKKAYVQDINTEDGDVSIYYDRQIDKATIQAAAEQYRTWMEYAYIGLGAIYLLQIVDAAVDAHLYYFDVGDDLSLQITPSLQYTASRTPVNGLSLRLTF